jgi:hypothetical protein
MKSSSQVGLFPTLMIPNTRVGIQNLTLNPSFRTKEGKEVERVERGGKR